MTILRRATGICAVFAVTALAGCGGPPPQLVIARADLGAEWPYSVDSVTVTCHKNGGVTADAGGKLSRLPFTTRNTIVIRQTPLDT